MESTATAKNQSSDVDFETQETPGALDQKRTRKKQKKKGKKKKHKNKKRMSSSSSSSSEEIDPKSEEGRKRMRLLMYSQLPKMKKGSDSDENPSRGSGSREREFDPLKFEWGHVDKNDNELRKPAPEEERWKHDLYRQEQIDFEEFLLSWREHKIYSESPATKALSQMEGKFIIESLEEGLSYLFHFEKVHFTGATKYQTVEILDTPAFGRCLMLDSLMQSSEKDEAIYHECLVHPALLAHPNPKRVFIGGGGEGATLREVLKHKSVELCLMCDLDEEVVRLCQTHLRNHNKGVLDPGYPRAQLVFEDAKKCMEASEGNWDVIILDLPDPVDCGPAFSLYTQEFYNICRDKLSPNGVFVSQSGPMSIISQTAVFSLIHSTLRSSFPIVAGYGTHVPSFGHEWGYNIAMKGAEEAAILTMDPEMLDAKIAARIDTSGPLGGLEFYDGIANRRIFSLGKTTRKCLAEEKRIAKEDCPMIFNAGKGINPEK